MMISFSTWSRSAVGGLAHGQHHIVGHVHQPPRGRIPGFPQGRLQLQRDGCTSATQCPHSGGSASIFDGDRLLRQAPGSRNRGRGSAPPVDGGQLPGEAIMPPQRSGRLVRDLLSISRIPSSSCALPRGHPPLAEEILQVHHRVVVRRREQLIQVQLPAAQIMPSLFTPRSFGGLDGDRSPSPCQRTWAPRQGHASHAHIDVGAAAQWWRGRPAPHPPRRPSACPPGDDPGCL